MMRFGWHWFARTNLQAILQVAWTYLLAIVVSGLFALSAYLPVIGGFMSKKLRVALEIPVWSVFSVAIIVALLVFVAVRKGGRVTGRGARTGRAQASTTRPTLRRFGLEWELTPHFFTYVDRENPEQWVLAESIRGPFCLTCGRLLQQQSRSGDYVVENPCLVCDARAPADLDGIGIQDLKLEVFREAQRLHRRRELPA